MVVQRFEFIIVPHVGVGPLQFGMLAADVYEILGQPSWRRGPDEFSDMTREEFAAHSCFVDFKPNRRCCAVDMYPDARAVLDGVNLMSMTYKTLVACLRAKGASVVEEEWVGFRCDDLGIACYASEVGDPNIPDARVESVIAYPRGYYDESDRLIATLLDNNEN